MFYELSNGLPQENDRLSEVTDQLRARSKPMDEWINNSLQGGIKTFLLGEMHRSQRHTKLEIQFINELLKLGRKVKIVLEVEYHKQELVNTLIQNAKEGRPCTQEDFPISLYFQLINEAAKSGFEITCVDDQSKENSKRREQVMHHRVKQLHEELSGDEILVFIVGRNHIATDKVSANFELSPAGYLKSGICSIRIWDTERNVPYGVVDIRSNPDLAKISIPRVLPSMEHFSDYDAILLT